MSEEVLVVPSARLDHLTHERGFVTRPDWFGSMTSARFVDRQTAESDESYRQVIPYVVLRAPTGLFSYGRTSDGGEARLHGLRSIGVGGHVNPGDLPEGLAGLRADPSSALARAARREIEEETVGLGNAPMRWIGFICEDETAVSRVHLGTVFLAEMDTPSVRLSDEGRLADARYLPVHRLMADRDQYEGWSRLVVEHLAAGAR